MPGTNNLVRAGLDATEPALGAPGPWMWLVALLAIQAVLILPVIGFGGAGNDVDESLYHYPGVLLIRQHWPRLDLAHDSLSPIAPGYHYFLATVSQITGPSLIAMRLVTAAISTLIPLLLFFWLSRYLPSRLAFIYSLPVVLCCFFLKAACRVVTDNPANLLSLIALMGIFLLPARGWRGAIPGIATTLAIMTRQLSAYLMAPALLQVVLEKFDLFEGDDQPKRAPSWFEFLPAIFFRLLPLVLFIIFLDVWHGLVPPAWQNTSARLSMAPLAYILAVVGFLGSFFVLSLGRLVEPRHWCRPWIAVAAIGGAVVSVISPTTWAPNEGRWGGWIWFLVRHVPSIHQRSLVFMIMSPLGAALICLMARLLIDKKMWKVTLLWCSALGGWITSYAVATNIYHHYFEVPIMMFFAVACALVIRKSENFRFYWPPMALLLAYDVVLSFIEIYGGVFFHLKLSALGS